MEGDGKGTAYPLFDKIADGKGGEDSPKGREPPGTVDMLRDIGGPLVFLNNRGDSHDGYHHDIECYDSFLHIVQRYTLSAIQARKQCIK